MEITHRCYMYFLLQNSKDKEIEEKDITHHVRHYISERQTATVQLLQMNKKKPNNKLE